MPSFDDLLARADNRSAPPTAPPPVEPRWVPIRTLAARHRTQILHHLLALGERDRYLRFGYPAHDEQIARYVEQIDFGRDQVFGIFNRRLALVAMAHLAYPDPVAGQPPASSEFGVSVSEHLRGQGIGARLFDHAVLHARNRGVAMLVIHALTENQPMLRLAQRAGATVRRSGSDADAWLDLPPVDLTSRLEQFVEDGAAEIDYSFKRQAHRVGRWMESVAAASRPWTAPDEAGPE